MSALCLEKGGKAEKWFSEDASPSGEAAWKNLEFINQKS